MDGIDGREQDNHVGSDADNELVAQVPVAEADVDFEDEIDGAALMEQFLSDPSHDYKSLKYGDVLEGIIMHVERDELLVDIGSKAEGIVPSKEFSSLSAEEKEALQVGDNILVFVVQAENQEGHPVVSIDRARQEKSWRQLQEVHEANEIIEAEVTNYNKGGLLVNLDGVRGFVPASQVSEIRGGDDSSKQADMARLIGTKLPLKVIEINRHRNRLILSERQAVQDRRDVMKEQLIQELTEGEVRQGRVSSICDFGAFVDIGGADGLVHLSELSWSRVRHPAELLKIGQEVDVYVLGINANEKKIALSIKRTQAEPWSRVANEYEVGQLVRGTVTQVVNFGAFARIEDGIEGLIHVSELADERLTHPKQLVEEGQELILRIIRIDPQRRRMGLSLRRALDTPDSELVSVFGEGILEERDALAQKIRAQLEAEGLLGTRQDEPEGEAEGAEAADGTTAQAIEAAPEQDAGEAQVAAFEERSRRAEEAAQQKQRRQRTRHPKNETAEQALASFEPDDSMSAMAMAFAMAGADASELLEEDETEETPAPSKSGKKAAKQEAAAEAATEESVEAPAGDESNGGDAEAATEKEAEPAAVKRSSKLPEEGEGTDWVAGNGTHEAPEGFEIKGNASSEIYHPKESPNYESTIAEIYFSSNEAAERLGYRLPKTLKHLAEGAASDAADSVADEVKGEE